MREVTLTVARTVVQVYTLKAQLRTNKSRLTNE